jgi:hypothetical protein
MNNTMREMRGIEGSIRDHIRKDINSLSQADTPALFNAAGILFMRKWLSEAAQLNSAALKKNIEKFSKVYLLTPRLQNWYSGAHR